MDIDKPEIMKDKNIFSDVDRVIENMPIIIES